MSTSKPRKTRVDTVAGQVAAAQHQDGIAWPADVVTPHPNAADQAKASRNFAHILASRSAEDWTEAQVAHVARLALLQVELDKVSQQLFAEGWVIEKQGANGRTVQSKNVLGEIQQQLNSQCVTLSQKLGLTGTDADPRTVRKQAKATPARVSLKSVPAPEAPVDWTQVDE